MTPMPHGEIESGKIMAVLCYLPFIGGVISVLCFAMKDNGFSLYHAKQAMGIWVILLVLWVARLAFGGWPVIGSATKVFWAVACVAAVIFIIIGIVNAATGQIKRLPLIGGAAEQWFAGFQKM